MTNKEILEKAIKLAIDGGWKGSDVLPPAVNEGRQIPDWTGIHYLIFNHDFAKALWGEEVKRWTGEPGHTGVSRITWSMPEWQIHLQQMVISDDPIKYLGDNM